MIRKFFNLDAPTTTTPSVAELMAKQGVFNNTNDPVAKPIVIEEKKEEAPPVTPTTTAATATVEKTTETPAPTTPAPVEKQKEEPQKTVPPQAENWQQVLKKQQPDAVLKELGYDDKKVKFLNELTDVDEKMLNFLNHWKAGGDIKEYLRELTTDYSKLSAEDVMRHQLQREYPKAKPQALEALFQAEVIKAYNLDSDDPDVLENGRLLLEAKADKFRDTLTQEQQKYLIPTPPEPKAATPDPKIEEGKQEFEKYATQVRESEYAKNIKANNKLVFGEGEDQFNFPVDYAALDEILFGGDQNWSLFDKGGDENNPTYTPNLERHYMAAAVMKYGLPFIQALADHFKTRGGKSAIAPIENPSKSGEGTPLTPDSTPKSPAEAMARSGRLVN